MASTRKQDIALCPKILSGSVGTQVLRNCLHNQQPNVLLQCMSKLLELKVGNFLRHSVCRNTRTAQFVGPHCGNVCILYSIIRTL